MKSITTILICFLIKQSAKAQEPEHFINERYSVHVQTTVINQFKSSFNARYSGDKSLSTNSESKTSITSTLFLGAKLWNGASVFLNPEIAGGSGLSEASGIAAATNGETFRIGDPAPQIYIARLFFNQIFPLSSKSIYQTSDFNQLAGKLPERYVSITIGKISISDIFDDNRFSHDPRTQFLSWALMSNGAWDYPANTRGYTPSIVLQYVSPRHELHFGFSLVPLTANGNEMNWKISKAGSYTIEYTHHHKLRNQDGTLRLLGFYTSTNMGNYKQSIELNPLKPNIEDTRKYGNTKFGFGINADQDFTPDLGCFFRTSWNDGNNETWAFTEIDCRISAGLTFSGRKWKRENDHIGLAYVNSGISGAHRDYLQAGGKGFILGDGNLNYSREHLVEFYYSTELVKNNIFLTGTYQFLVNPGYNLDRQGPVHIFSIRMHANI